MLLWRYQKNKTDECKSLVWASNNINKFLILMYTYSYDLAMNYYLKTNLKGSKYFIPAAQYNVQNNFQFR
jgi:hypothetical protein